MIAFGVVIVAGLAIGLARGGSLRNLTAARLHLMPLVIVAVALQLGAQFVPLSVSIAAYGLVVISYAVAFAFAGANWRVPGMAFIAIGSALNYTVVLVNRGMPISATAAARVGYGGAKAQELVLRGKHFIETGTHHAHLMPLGDVIPLWRQPAVASIGDMVIWAGLILLIASLVVGPRGRRTKLDPRDAYAYTPPDHVSAHAGDVTLAELDSHMVIDLRDPPSQDPSSDERSDRGGAGTGRTSRI
ncbi:MAG: DUF5317 domain-containing protein [Actinomycetota bacterium]